MSDLHLEFAPFEVPSLPEDHETTLLLAGDIAVGERPHTYVDFLIKASAQFAHVVYVPGNHEYYGGNIGTTWQFMKDTMAEALGTVRNLHMINNETVTVGDTTIIGATLWTDFLNGNPLEMLNAQAMMNDYRKIREGKRKIRPYDTLKLHQKSKFYIFQQLRALRPEGSNEGPMNDILIMTHHAPSTKSISPQYANSPVNGSYANNLPIPVTWVHGHVHTSNDYYAPARVLSNPRGYEDENKEFDPWLRF